jgi:hypothetical protein
VCGIRTRRGSRRRGLIDCTGRWRPKLAPHGTTIKRRSKLRAHKVGIELPRAGVAEHDEFVIAVTAHVPEHWSGRDARVAASSWCAVGQVAITATFLLIMVNLARSIEDTCGLGKPNVPRGGYARAVT